jgi:hypothetical protein
MNAGEPIRSANLRRIRRRRAGAVMLVAMLGDAAIWVGCGGTTGRDRTAAPALEARDAGERDGRADAPSIDADEGWFDVEIPFADRVIPDVQPAPDAGPLDWPVCPRDVGIDPDGKMTDIDQSAYVVPAEYDDAGHVRPAGDGSVCASHVWLGRKSWDDCVRQQTTSQAALPPCNAVVDAGTARRGPRTGESLHRLCQELAVCIVRTGCGSADVTECLCGLGTNGSYPACKQRGLAGPCAMQELAALQIDPQDPAALDTALGHYVETASPLYLAASQLNQLYAIGKSNDCFSIDGGGTD